MDIQVLEPLHRKCCEKLKISQQQNYSYEIIYVINSGLAIVRGSAPLGLGAQVSQKNFTNQPLSLKGPSATDTRSRLVPRRFTEGRKGVSAWDLKVRYATL
jgi:hypothetical protein